VISVVVLSATARKDLSKCPVHIVRKFMGWVGSVQAVGLEVTRQGPGYHDEPLKGKWAGHRSIRLSKSYRAIYTVRHDGTVEFARVEAVSKHEY
jgi:proteic killer suppression protein